MKVVYRKTILEWIAQERVRALAAGREIEKIVLSLAEARQLYNESISELRVLNGCGTPGVFGHWLERAEKLYNNPGPQPTLTVMGIDIEVSR